MGLKDRKIKNLIQRIRFYFFKLSYHQLVYFAFQIL